MCRVSKSHVCRVSLSRYLAVDADHLATVITIVGEHVLVALDAEGVVLPQHVPGHVPRHSHSHVSWDLPVPGKAVVAVMAEEDLILDILLLGEGKGLLVVMAKPKSFKFN